MTFMNPTPVELAMAKVTESLSVPLDNVGVTIESLDSFQENGEVASITDDVTQRVYGITSNEIALQLIVRVAE